MPVYKLTYFDGRGRAETIRLTFAAGGIRYEDRRIEKSLWGEMKPKMPWGSLPVLDVDGKVIGQSMAIARYVAREAGLAGRNSFEQAMVDSIVDSVTELREAAFGMAFMPDGPEKQAKAKDFSEKTLPTTLSNLERIIGKKSFFLGDNLTLADIHFFAIAEMLKGKFPDVLKSAPNLQNMYRKVETYPRIADYLKKRPATPF